MTQINTFLGAVKLPAELPVICKPVPSSPFYVRWLNQYGGIDYWMFSKRQALQREQSDVETFNPYITDFSTATGTSYVASKTIEEKIVAGAQNLNGNEWNGLSQLAYSPVVQYYQPETEKWIDIVVDKAENEYLSDSYYNTIEFVFLLPNRQLQF